MEDVIFAGTAGRAAAGPGRGHAHHRQHRRRAADRLHRGLDHPADVPLRRERVRDQRRLLPAARHPGAAVATPASAGRCTSSSARASSTPCCTPSPRTGARSSRRRPASSSTASARRRRCASSTRCRPTSTGSPTSPPSCAASSSRWAGRPRWPGGPPASRPTCATPGCGCSPTTWSTLRDDAGPGGRRRDARCGTAASEVEARARRGAGRGWPSWRRRIAADAPVLARAQETWYRLSALQERFRGTAPARRASGSGTCPRRADDERPGRDPDELEAEAAEVREQEEALRDALERRPGPAGRGGRPSGRSWSGRWPRPSGRWSPRCRAIADRREGLARLGRPGRRGRAPGSAADGRGDRPARRRGGRGAGAGRGARGASSRRCRPRSARSTRASSSWTSGTRPRSPRTTRRRRGSGRSATPSGRPSRTAPPGRPARRRSRSACAARTAPARCSPRGDRLPGLLGSVAALLTVEPGLRGGAGRRAGRARRRGRGLRRRRRRRRRCGCSRPTTPAGPALLVGGAAHRRPTGPAVAGAARRARAGRSTWSSAPPSAAAGAGPGAARRRRRAPTWTPRRELVATRPGAARGHRRRRPARRRTRRPAARPRRRATSRCRPRSTRPGRAGRGRARRGDGCATELAERRGGRRRRQARGRGRAGRAASECRRASATPSPRSSAELGAGGPLGRRPRPTGSDQARRPRPSGPRAGPGRAGRPGGAAAAGRGDPGRRGAVHRASGTRCGRAVPQARQNEMEVRLAVRTAEERVARARRPGRLAAARRPRPSGPPGSGPRRAGRPGPRRRDRRARSPPAPTAALTRIAASLAAAADRARRRASRPGSVREAELLALRASSRELAGELERLTTRCTATRWPGPSSGCGSSSWRPRRPRSSAWTSRRWSPSTARTCRCPPPPTWPSVAAAEADGKPSRPSRCRTTGRSRRSGPPGPSATWPCSARSTRWRWRSSPRWRSGYKFLSDQLEDLKATRRDLLTVVKDVDERILEVFASAFADTAREFEKVFAALFPGGEGRLVLTDPEDMLDHRRRGRGPAAGQEDQAAVAAVRRRAVADRGRAAVRDLPGPAQPVLHHGRGRGRARRRQPRPAAHADRAAAREAAS